jgi:hypothetical protein
MAGEITNMLRVMYQNGIYDFVLPFILFFAIFYAVMFLMPFFNGIDNDKKNRISIIISIVLSLIVVVPHVTGSYKNFGIIDPVNLIIELASTSTGIIATIFLFLLVAGVFGASLHKSTFTSLFLLVIFLYLIFFVLDKYQIVSGMPALGTLFQPYMIAIAVVVLAIYFMVSKKSDGGAGTKIKNDLHATFWDSGDSVPKKEEKKNEKKPE